MPFEGISMRKRLLPYIFLSLITACSAAPTPAIPIPTPSLASTPTELPTPTEAIDPVAQFSQELDALLPSGPISESHLLYSEAFKSQDVLAGFLAEPESQKVAKLAEILSRRFALSFAQDCAYSVSFVSDPAGLVCETTDPAGNFYSFRPGDAATHAQLDQIRSYLSLLRNHEELLLAYFTQQAADHLFGTDTLEKAKAAFLAYQFEMDQEMVNSYGLSQLGIYDYALNFLTCQDSEGAPVLSRIYNLDALPEGEAGVLTGGIIFPQSHEAVGPIADAAAKYGFLCDITYPKGFMSPSYPRRAFFAQEEVDWNKLGIIETAMHEQVHWASDLRDATVEEAELMARMGTVEGMDWLGRTYPQLSLPYVELFVMEDGRGTYYAFTPGAGYSVPDLSLDDRTPWPLPKVLQLRNCTIALREDLGKFQDRYLAADAGSALAYCQTDLDAGAVKP